MCNFIMYINPHGSLSATFVCVIDEKMDNVNLNEMKFGNTSFVKN
jgi:hypothetical protein